MAAFTVIDHQELGASAWSPNASTDMTIWQKGSIPASYDHLMLEASIRSAASAYWQNLWIRVGGVSDSGLDTGANYSSTYLHATGSPTSGRATAQTKWAYQYIAAASVLADTFSTLKIWIPNYANTANFKQVIIETAVENNSTTGSQWYLTQTAGLWSDLEAITDIGVSEPNSGMIQYSSFTLYGITGA
jgi:hypothetical protein